MKERLASRARLALAVLPWLWLLSAGCAEAPDSGVAEPEHKVLRRGNGGAPGTLDPVLAVDVHAFNILVDLYEGLVAQGPDGQLIPGVAESWDVSSDGLEYRFHLRSNARWSDGSPVVAADFVRSFQRAANPATASVYSALLAPLEHFAAIQAGDRPVTDLGVTALSDFELSMRLAAPASHWLSVIALPIAYPTRSTDHGRALSNGPYALAERSAAGYVRLTRNPHYWDAQSISIDEVEFHPVVDPVAELNMYRAGELDTTHIVPSEHIAALRENRPDELRIAPSLALYYLAFDLGEAPLDDPKLRQALSMAIDRTALVRLIGRGERPAFGIVPPGVEGHDNAVYDWQSWSQSERARVARELYAEAGYDPDNPLRLHLVYDVGDVHERVALAVTAMWSDTLGVETTLRKLEWKMFLDTRDSTTEWDVMRFAWFGDYNSPMTFLEIFHSGSRQNLPGYDSAAYDQKLAIAAGETDDQARRRSMHAAEQHLLDDYPVVPLYFFVSKHMVRPGVTGFEDNILDRHPTRFLDIATDDANRD